ncbi:MAG: hypothetical protein H0V89_05880 [Deltaproteobacteria bacterium]|nr:hypothetical protein [Deltaproteobacteria bacterium]
MSSVIQFSALSLIAALAVVPSSAFAQTVNCSANATVGDNNIYYLGQPGCGIAPLGAHAGPGGSDVCGNTDYWGLSPWTGCDIDNPSTIPGSCP